MICFSEYNCTENEKSSRQSDLHPPGVHFRPERLPVLLNSYAPVFRDVSLFRKGIIGKVCVCMGGGGSP